MAYSEALAQRIRDHLGDVEGLNERKMFGGIAFMLNGNMLVGVSREDLMVRTGPDNYEPALTKPGARVEMMAGRPMKGMVFVDSSGYAGDGLVAWIDLALGFVTTLSPK